MFGVGVTALIQDFTSSAVLFDLKVATTKNDICSTIVPYESIPRRTK